MKKNLPLQGSVLLASILSFNTLANEANTGGSFHESLPMPELYGSFDVSFGLEIADETAFALEDAIGDANYVGVKGHIPLKNGHKINYVHEEFITLVNGLGMGGSYQTYLGYELESGEVRVGNLDLPLKRIMDSVDLFSGTYADLSTIVLPNTTANSALMYLGASEKLNYAVSIDTGNTGAENANNNDAMKLLRFGAMAQISLNEKFSVGAGFEHSDASTGLGFTAEMMAGDNLTLNASLSRTDFNAGPAPLTITVGGAAKVSEDTQVKAQLGFQDPDVNGADNSFLIAAGIDKKFADNLTAYGLVGIMDAIIPNPAGPTRIEFGATDGAANIIAAGIKFTF